MDIEDALGKKRELVPCLSYLWLVLWICPWLISGEKITVANGWLLLAIR